MHLLYCKFTAYSLRMFLTLSIDFVIGIVPQVLETQAKQDETLKTGGTQEYAKEMERQQTEKKPRFPLLAALRAMLPGRSLQKKKPALPGPRPRTGKPTWFN